MKKVSFAFLIVCTAFVFVSCKKEVIGNPEAAGIEQGQTFMSFENVDGIDYFNADSIKGLGIPIWDPIQFQAYKTLSSIKLPIEPPTTVYIASTPGALGYDQAEQYFNNHGYKMCSVGRVGKLIKKYSYIILGLNFRCTNLPVNLNLGNGASEPTTLMIMGAVPNSYIWFGQKTNALDVALYAIEKNK